MRTASHFRLAIVAVVAVTALAAYRGEEPVAGVAPAPLVAPPPQTPLQTVVSSLRRIHVDGSDTRVPAEARPRLDTLKTEIERVVSETLADPFAAGRDASDLESSVNVRLANEGVLIEPSDDTTVYESDLDTGYDYGDVYPVTVTAPPGHTDLLVVTTTIGVCCGTDTSLYLYRKRDHRWSLSLAYAAHDYGDVSDAHGQFQVRVSLMDHARESFVVVANVTPWCTSNLRALRYAVLRESGIAHEPDVLLQTRRSIFLDEAPNYSLDVDGDTFELVFRGDKFMKQMADGAEFDDPGTKTTLRYRVSGTSVSKILEQ